MPHLWMLSIQSQTAQDMTVFADITITWDSSGISWGRGRLRVLQHPPEAKECS